MHDSLAPQQTSPSPRAERTALVLATLFAAAVTLPFLARRSVWLDEAGSIGLAESWSAMRADSNMWLYYVLLRPWLALGRGEWMLRFPSALYAIAAVPLIGVVARRLFGGWSGPVAALLLASNLFFLRYAAEARAYSLVLLLVVVASAFYLRLLERPGIGAWAGYVLSGAAGIYAHFFAVPVLAVHAAGLLFGERRSVPWKAFAAAAGAMLVLVLPIPLFAALDSPISWIPRPDWSEPLRTASRLAGGRRLLALYGLAGCVGALAALRRGDARRRWAFGFVALWAGLPFVATFAFSLVVKPMFLARYLIVCLPGLVLAAAAGIAALRPRAAGLAALGLIVAAAIPGFVSSLHPRPEWRELTRLVVSEARPGDVAIVYRAFNAPPFDYYLERFSAEAPRVLHGADDELAGLAAQHDRVWLVLYYSERFHAGSTEGAQALERALEATHARVREHTVGKVRAVLYDRRPGPKVAGYESPGPRWRETEPRTMRNSSEWMSLTRDSSFSSCTRLRNSTSSSATVLTPRSLARKNHSASLEVS